MRISRDKLCRMMVESKDKLPSPAAIDCRRKMWVGIGWIDEGPADGTEPLIVSPAVVFAKIGTHARQAVYLVKRVAQPKVGDRVEWREEKKGEVQSGVVRKIKNENARDEEPLFFIERGREQ
jgi:hypothetical protein